MSTISIIGSGMGGLVAGNLLAKKGHKVTIFESHSTPGGYTAGFWRKGFYFESGTLSFESSQQVFSVMKDIGVFDRIEFTRQYGRWIAPQLDCVVHSWSELKKAFLEAYSNEQKDLSQYFSELDRMCNVLRSLAPPNNLISFITYPFKLMKGIGILKKYDKMTAPEFTTRYLDKESAGYQMLKDLGYPDMNAVILAGAVLSLIEDYWTVKTGMQSWADTLADNFKKLGGELILKSHVDRVITKNGTAVGVSCGSKTYDADYVLSASDYKKTFLNLLDDTSILSKDFIAKVKNATVSASFFVVYLGLTLSYEKMKEYLKVPHIYYYTGQPVDFYNSKDEKFFEKTSYTFYSPSLHNPNLAPEGKSSLMIMAICPHQWMNNWGGGDKGAYKRLKENVKNALIEKASAIIPNIRKYIEFNDAATPLTYERYTHNTDGASSAWSWNPNKRFYKNMVTTHTNTPVKNLYISSCWSTQIGGVPSAISAACKCTRKIQ
jgi:phytoene dehydrogenase-like protein